METLGKKNENQDEQWSKDPRDARAPHVTTRTWCREEVDDEYLSIFSSAVTDYRRGVCKEAYSENGPSYGDFDCFLFLFSEGGSG